MTVLSDKQDAFGHEMIDCLRGRDVREIVERDDGLIESGQGPTSYFAPYAKWRSHEKRAMRYVRGKVLDIGSGAGRVGLHLQSKGFDVMCVDNSPLAIKVCRERGVRKARALPVTQLTRRVGCFDTLMMFGNNFGLLGGWKRARWLLRRFNGMTSDRARIIAESLDPYQTQDPDHLSYQERNRKRGRMSGQLRLRVRYRTYATPWFDYLFVSQVEMAAMIDGTGWQIARVLPGNGSMYIAVLEKTDGIPT